MLTPSRLRAARAIINAKQSELARAAGISLATLNNIERGIGDPRTSTLEAIERALLDAGVEVSGDETTDVVVLHRLARPRAYDTFLASRRVLEVLGPDSLTKVEKVLFFARRIAAPTGEDRHHRICTLVEGSDRTVLFDQVDFNVANGSRAAEVAGIMLAAFAYHRGQLFYLSDLLEDTTALDAQEVVRHLHSLPWRELRHPAEFFDVFDDWEGRLTRFASREGHPMRDLLALVAALEEG